MSVLCERLPWDSTFFGFPVARVGAGTMDGPQCHEAIEWCLAEGVRLLYFLADNDAVIWALAADSGFRPVDIRVEMEYEPSRPTIPSMARTAGIVLREATEEDLHDLLPVAATAHTDSRFFADPAVPPEKARELFALWLKRSVRHEIADVVFVAAVEGRPVSYISGSLTNGLGSIGLVGVHEEARKRGIGLAMVRHLLEWFRQRGAAKITVVTQGRNSGSQRVYQRCGFVTQSVRVWFHRWFGQA